MYNFLAHHIFNMKRKYRTIAKYRCALRLPLLVSLDIDINTVLSALFMRGVFNTIPPVRQAPMPAWSLNSLLSFLNSNYFEPLEKVDLFHLSLKTLCLILLATGRRIGEIAHLSRDSFSLARESKIHLQWVPGFTAKYESARFTPTFPSISPIESNSPTILSLCPVRAYKVYIKRISESPGMQSNNFLWDHGKDKNKVSIPLLSRKFIKLVEYSRIEMGIFDTINIGPHHTRKLAASYGARMCKNLEEEETLREKMGFSALKILRKVYINFVPPLDFICVLPMGVFYPGISNNNYYRDIIQH